MLLLLLSRNMKFQLVNSMSFGYNWVNEPFYTLILSLIYIFSASLLENEPFCTLILSLIYIFSASLLENANILIY